MCLSGTSVATTTLMRPLPEDDRIRTRRFPPGAIMSYRRTCFLLPLLLLVGCGGRDEPRASSTPAPVPVANQAPPTIPAETRRALISQRLAKRPISEGLQARLIESWVIASDGYDQAGMDRLLSAIDSSIEAVDDNRFNASKELVLGRTAVAGSTIIGALINGFVIDGGGRMPITVDCGAIRANGWVERSSARSNRVTVIINSLSVQEASGKNVTYQHPQGLAYLMGPEGLEGLTLQAVTDQRGNSWLGLRKGTLVTLILIHVVDHTLASNAASDIKSPITTPAPADKPAAGHQAPGVPAEKEPAAEQRPSEKVPVLEPAPAAADK